MSNNKPMILVIDDTPSNLMTLGTTLAREFDLQIATSGAMGLALAVNNPPDLILLDVMMPEMDGFETCQHLKADPKLKNVPVIFVTALNDPLSETRGLDLGAADYISKPINVEIARQRIRNLLEREHLRKEVEAQLAERQRVQMELQESEQRFRHFFEKNSSVMLLIDPFTGVIDEANEAAATFYGYAKTRLVGMLISEINTLPAERINEERQLALHEKRNYFLFPHRLASGEIRDVEVHSTPIETEGKPMLFTIVHDITERKQAEEMLRKLSVAVEQSPASVVITDIETCIQYVNPRFFEVTGYSAAEVVGQNPRILGSGLTTKETYAELWGKLSSGQPWKGELLNKRKNGELYWEETQVAPVKDPAGVVTHFVAVKTDITKRKQLEEAREEVLSRLNKIASRVPGVVFQYRLRPDGSSCFPFASEAIRVIYRVSPEEVREDAAKVLANVHPDDMGGIATSIQKSAQDLTPWRHEYRVKFDDGTVRWLFGNSLPQREADGGTLWHGFITDITEHKQAEAELDEHRHHLEELVQVRTMALSIAKEAAESANRAKSTFLANMSHELRTPMNGIMGMTSLAQRRATDPKLLEVLGKVMQSSQRLLEIINNILDISKIEAEQMILDPVDFTLNRVIEELNTLTSFDTKNSGLSLTISISPDLGRRHLRGDALRLSQVLLNLTGNAIKFTTSGSVKVCVNLVKENPMGVVVRFEVLDTGIGIPKEIQDRIFNPFEQADGSTTRNFGGTGLGLAICKQLVQVMGGEIGVESQVGVGSTFWFTAQFENVDSTVEMELSQTSASAELELLSNYFGALILLAEDDPICQEIAMALMDEAGLRVDLAKDGCQAIEMAAQTEYDLILMDMQMPKMNGIEATKAIRALHFQKNIPILAMTANAFAEDRARCIAAGMDDFIAKPVDPDALFAVLLKWLSRTQL